MDDDDVGFNLATVDEIVRKPAGARSVFVWRHNARMAGDAQKVGEELEKVRAESPTLTIFLDKVIDVATPEDSVLHRYFTWDDSIAAHRYRQQEVRGIINHMSRHYVMEDRQVIIAPAYVSQPGHVNTYVPLDVAMSATRMRVKVLRDKKATSSRSKHDWKQYLKKLPV